MKKHFALHLTFLICIPTLVFGLSDDCFIKSDGNFVPVEDTFELDDVIEFGCDAHFGETCLIGHDFGHEFGELFCEVQIGKGTTCFKNVFNGEGGYELNYFDNGTCVMIIKHLSGYDHGNWTLYSSDTIATNLLHGTHEKVSQLLFENLKSIMNVLSTQNFHEKKSYIFQLCRKVTLLKLN